MTTALYCHPISRAHDAGRYHPESPQRYEAVMAALSAPGFEGLDRREAPEASREQLDWAHSSAYIDSVFRAIPHDGYVELDADTVVCPQSGEAALRAAGGICAAVDAVLGGEVRNAFCASRPPGHHAEHNRAMGFCLFCNPAIGAYQARVKHELGRIAVLDFDVHHGNGSQDILWDDADMFYASTHQSPLFPGTGSEGERGVAGNVLNIPLSAGTDGTLFRQAWEVKILPAVEAFKPELIIVSAGFDGHREDPLASMNLEDEDFRWISERLVETAETLCSGRLVSILEGGYNVEALGRCVAAHVGALMKA